MTYITLINVFVFRKKTNTLSATDEQVPWRSGSKTMLKENNNTPRLDSSARFFLDALRLASLLARVSSAAPQK